MRGVSLRAFARRLPCRRPRQLRGLSAAAPEAGAEFEGTDGDAPRQFDARWSPRDKSRLQLFKVAKRSGVGALVVAVLRSSTYCPFVFSFLLTSIFFVYFCVLPRPLLFFSPPYSTVR